MPDNSPPAGLTIAAAVIVIALTLYLLIVGEAIFIPLVLAIFITYLLVALAHALRRLPLGRLRLGEGAAITGAAVIFVLVIAVLVQLFAGNIRAVAEAAPAYQERLVALQGEVSHFIAANFNGGRPVTVTSMLQEINLQSIVGRLAGMFQKVASDTFQIIIYVAFLLLEVGNFDRKLAAMFPGEARQTALRGTLREIGRRVQRYVLIKSLMSFLNGASTLVVLLAIGVDFAPFWALLHFVLNFVPYIGALVAIVLPSLMAVLQFGSVPIGLLTAAILITKQGLIDNVLEPRMAGRTLNLSPIAIMLGLSVWGTMWGVIGMILSVPIMVMTMIVLAQFPRTRPLAVLMSERGDVR